jgi:hypothetical protein
MAMPFDVKKNPTFLGVEAAKGIIKDVAAGRRTLGLIGSGTGVGKTFYVRQICRRHLIGHVPEDNPANAEALVSMTWNNRHHPVHVLNECDHLFRVERTINVLKLMHEEPRKCALYTVEARKNEQRRESGGLYVPTIAPTQFMLGNGCRQLFTTNLNYQDPAITKDLPPEHWMALLRRGIDPVWIPTHGRDGLDLFEHTYWMATEGNMLKSLQFTYEVARDAVRFYLENIHLLPEISPACLVRIATTIREAGTDKVRCEARLGQMLLPTDQRPKLVLEQPTIQSLLWPKKPPTRRKKVQPDKPQKSVEKPAETVEQPASPLPITREPAPAEQATSEPSPSPPPLTIQLEPDFIVAVIAMVERKAPRDDDDPFRHCIWKRVLKIEEEWPLPDFSGRQPRKERQRANGPRRVLPGVPTERHRQRPTDRRPVRLGRGQEEADVMVVAPRAEPHHRTGNPRIGRNRGPLLRIWERAPYRRSFLQAMPRSPPPLRVESTIGCGRGSSRTGTMARRL